MQIQPSSTDPCKLLTGKQLDALNLLVKHKTSKEISRELGISPHTVDQRIEAAKRRLGVSTRGELVQAYLQLKRMCHQLTYEESHIDASTHGFERSYPELPLSSETAIDPERLQQLSRHDEQKDYRVVPELFDGRYGTLFRLLAIIGFPLILLIIILVAASIYVNLSEFVAR